MPFPAHRLSRARLLSARPRAPRGAVLLVALIFCAIIALSIGSYLRLSTQNMRITDRAHLGTLAMNLAEAGAEQAVWSFNQHLAGNTHAWSTTNGWRTPSGTTITGKFTNFTLPAHLKAEVRVHVQDYNSTGVVRPRVVALAVVHPSSGPPVERYLEITLRRRSRFATGIVGRHSVRFNGNKTIIDSWNSVGANGAVVAYSNSTRRSNGSVGSASVEVNSLVVGNADVYGYVSTAGPDPKVGAQGTVGVWGDASGTVNQNRIARDFSANFDDVGAPAAPNSLAAISGAITLPQTGGAGGNTILDTPSTLNGQTVYIYSVPSIDLSSGAALSISASRNVVLVVTNSVGSAVRVSGQSSISIGNGGSLALYTAGDISITGRGAANGSNNGNGTNNLNQPKNFQIWGTRPYNPNGTPQDIRVVGNGNLSAVIYAPFGDIKLAGSSSSGPGSARNDVYGSVVGYTISILGEESFHYDESLASFDGTAPFGITRWREITQWRQLTDPADKAIVASLLSF